MSVLFLPPSAGAASVPDASETVKGIIRIATSAEATAGTDDLTSMTPAKVKSVVDAAVVGGVTYKGTFDAAAPLDLSNAVQGDLYIIDGAGTYQGKTWAVGDHLLVNADMGGTVDPAKIDKIDSTDSVTSVAGRTGAVVLSTADISGLATVATSGAYSDLSGTPSLATVATTGAYSDLSGTPSLATVATTGAYSDLTGAPDVPVLENNFVNTTSTATAISENGHYAYWLSNNTSSITLTLPVQGAGVVAYLTFATLDSVGHTVTLGSGQFRLSGGVSATSLSIPAGTTRSFYYYGATYWELSSNELNELGDVTITSPSNGEALVYNSTSGLWENSTVSASVAALDDIGDVNTTGVSTNNVLKYDGANWVDGSVAYSEVTGTPSLATVATSGAYSDLSGTPSLATVATTGAYSDLSGTPDVPDFQTITVNSNTTLSSSLEDGCYLIMIGSTATVTIPAYPTGKSLVFRFVSFGAGTCTIQQASGGTRLYEFGNSGIIGVNSVNVASGATRTFHLWAAGSTVALNYWSEASPFSTSATVAALDDIGDVDTTGVSTNNVLKYDGANWVDGSVAYSEVTGTPTLATVATSGAYSDLSGTPSLATVATTGAYSDLTGTPTLGTAAALDVGTSATNVVQLDGSARLPAVDGSQLTNLPSAGIPALTSASPTSSPYNISTSLGFMEVYLLNPSVALTVNIPSAATATSGYRYNIKNLSANTVTVTPSSGTIDGSANFALGVQNSSLTLVSDGSNWFVI